MVTRLAFMGVLAASAIALATSAQAAPPPGANEAEAVINALTAPLVPILSPDAPPAAAAAPAPAKHHGKRHRHHHKH